MMTTQTAPRNLAGITTGKPSTRTRDAAGVDPLAHAEAQQRIGQRMIAAGFAVTVLGVVGYCVACFAAGLNASMSDILFANAVPFARATLVGLGIGTALWLVGSFLYLHGVIAADELTAGDPGQTRQN